MKRKKKTLLRGGGTVPVDERDVQRILAEIGRMYVCKKDEHGIRVCMPRRYGIVKLPRLWSQRLHRNLPISVAVELWDPTALKNRADMQCFYNSARSARDLPKRWRRRHGGKKHLPARREGAECTMRLQAPTHAVGDAPKENFLEAAFGSIVRHELAHGVQFDRDFDVQRTPTKASAGPWHMRPEEVEAVLSQSERDLRLQLTLRPGRFRPEEVLLYLPTRKTTRRWEKENPAAYRRALQMSARVLTEADRLMPLLPPVYYRTPTQEDLDWKRGFAEEMRIARGQQQVK